MKGILPEGWPCRVDWLNPANLGDRDQPGRSDPAVDSPFAAVATFAFAGTVCRFANGAFARVTAGEMPRVLSLVLNRCEWLSGLQPALWRKRPRCGCCEVIPARLLRKRATITSQQPKWRRHSCLQRRDSSRRSARLQARGREESRPSRHECLRHIDSA